MNRKSNYLAIAAAFPLVMSSASAALVSFNTNTDQNTRSLFQVDGTTPYTVAAATGAVNIGNNTANAADDCMIWASTASTYSLSNAGDSITMTGQVTFRGIVSNSTGQFRAGLFDTNDKAGATGWLGYMGMADSTGTSTTSFSEKIETHTGLYTSGTGTVALQTISSATVAMVSNIEYTISMTLTRNASNQIEYVFDMSESANSANKVALYSGTDTTPLTFDFDRIGFLAGGSMDADRVELRNFDVTKVPEPSTALLGGLGILALLRRRRK